MQPPNRTCPFRPELFLLLTVLAGALVSIAASGMRPPPAASFFVLTPLPTGTPSPPPAGGWWDEVTFTQTAPSQQGTPSASLPSLPKLELGIVRGGQRAGQPVPYDVVACAEGPVRITGIVTGNPGWWEVQGTAPAPPNWYWKAELSSDGQNWALLYSSRTPAEGGVLLRFLTTTVRKGSYLLRVMLVDHTGNYPNVCTVRVTV